MPETAEAETMAPGGPAGPDQLARNGLLNLVGLGLPLVVAVVAIPPIVEGLGPERFGVLGLLWVSVAYLALLDLGLGRATTRYAAVAMAGGETERLREIVGVAVTSQLALGVVGGAAAAALAGPLVTRFLELDPALHREAIRSFVVLAAAAPAVTVTNSFRGVLEADQRFGLINVVRIPVSAANFLVPLAGVWLGWALPTIVAWMVVVRVGALVAYAGAALRTWPVLVGPVRIRGDRFRELAGFGGWVTVSAVVSALLLYIDRFVVGGVASMEAAGYYTVPHEMVTRLDILPAALVLTLFPALAAMGAGPDPDTGTSTGVEARGRLIAGSVEYLLMLVAPLLIALAISGGDVLTVWLGGEFASRAALPLAILAFGMLANAVAFVPAAAIQAAGRPDLTARFHLIELPIHLVVLWVLVHRWGLAGAAAASSLRSVLDLALLVGATSRLGLATFAAWARSRVGGVAVALAIFTAATSAAVGMVERPVPALAAVLGLLALWAGWVWSRVLRPAERKGLLRAAGLGR
jgi:O-antigen/teichoic acid export membrane protein